MNTFEQNVAVRVYMMICLGAAVITITSTEFFKAISFSWTSDPGRISAQIISALGFLGTGLIWMSEEERKIRGVSVAASLWFTAIIGMLIGIGFHGTAAIGTLFIILIYWIYSLVDWNILIKKFKE